MEMKIEKLKIVYDNITDYHNKDCISASGLKLIAKKNYSVQHYLQKEYKTSAAMELGKAAHVLLLEGMAEFDKQYFALPKLDLRKKPDKEIKASIETRNQLKESVSADVYFKLCTMYDNLQNDDDAYPYTKGKYEVSHYGEYLGVPVRVRPDVLGNDWISDLKTCQDASPKAFKRDIWNYGYNIQATFYCDMLGYDVTKFRFIAAETNAPYAIQLYGLSDEMIEFGRLGWQTAFHYWKQYLKSGKITKYIGDNVAKDGAILL